MVGYLTFILVLISCIIYAVAVGEEEGVVLGFVMGLLGTILAGMMIFGVGT